LGAVGIHVHEWAVIRHPDVREVGAAKQMRHSAFQSVLTRYTLLSGALGVIAGRVD